jgi:hypothetical protein
VQLRFDVTIRKGAVIASTAMIIVEFGRTPAVKGIKDTRGFSHEVEVWNMHGPHYTHHGFGIDESCSDR